MDTTLRVTLEQRRAFADILTKVSLEDLNAIPTGFNNNIMWNIGHIIATQQLLVYSLAGERWTVDKEIIKAFRNGTKPERLYTEQDRQELLGLLAAPIEATHEQRLAGGFMDYQTFTAATGFEITDYDSAVAFNVFHEGLHLGYIFSIRKFL